MKKTCVVLADYSFLIMPYSQYRLEYDYKYKYYKYHHDPEYRRKCIDNAIAWRRQNDAKKKKQRPPKEPRFRIQQRIDGEMRTVFELS